MEEYKFIINNKAYQVGDAIEICFLDGSKLELEIESDSFKYGGQKEYSLSLGKINYDGRPASLELRCLEEKTLLIIFFYSNYEHDYRPAENFSCTLEDHRVICLKDLRDLQQQAHMQNVAIIIDNPSAKKVTRKKEERLEGKEEEIIQPALQPAPELF